MAVVALCFGIAACATPTSAYAEVPQKDIEFLIDVGVKDFASFDNVPTDFRNVKAALWSPDVGQDRSMICGEFFGLIEGEGYDWYAFSLVKTSDYENWIGGSAVSNCASEHTQLEEEDLSDAMKAALSEAAD